MVSQTTISASRVDLGHSLYFGRNLGFVPRQRVCPPRFDLAGRNGQRLIEAFLLCSIFAQHRLLEAPLVPGHISVPASSNRSAERVTPQDDHRSGQASSNVATEHESRCTDRAGQASVSRSNDDRIELFAFGRRVSTSRGPCRPLLPPRLLHPCSALLPVLPPSAGEQRRCCAGKDE